MVDIVSAVGEINDRYYVKSDLPIVSDGGHITGCCSGHCLLFFQIDGTFGSAEVRCFSGLHFNKYEQVGRCSGN